jgi:hypothetical protein
MVEERSRATQFFQLYKPVVVQELTLINEIEKLQSIVDETTVQCQNPANLPETAEEMINDFKLPDHLRPGNRESQAGAVSILIILIELKTQKYPGISVCWL